MKKLFFLFALGVSVIFTNTAKSQNTAGTMTITFTQPIPTNPSGSKNVMAAWIEDNSGNFIKTKLRFWGNNTNDHLPTWKTKSAQNTVDATTGATLTSSSNPTAFGNKSISWNGTNVSATVVIDGVYKLWIESSWQSSLPTNSHNDIISFSFTKGVASDHQVYVGDTYFNTITIDWVPSVSSINELSNLVKVYPNPSRDFINIDLPDSKNINIIQIFNIKGEKMYQTAVKSGETTKSIDIINYANGTYKIILKSKTEIATISLIINK